MFNLKKHSQSNAPGDLLYFELRNFDIFPDHDGTIELRVGDGYTKSTSLEDCDFLLKESIQELKKTLLESWEDLADVALLVIHNESYNPGSLENLLFLNSVKNAVRLSSNFSQLANITKSLLPLFNVDLAKVSPVLIKRFNHNYLTVSLINHLIMEELYRRHLLARFKKITKTAQVSGQWANLDLPMKERMWEWQDDDEEYFGNREKARKEQTRYNPETNKFGFYYVWQDYSRDPYSFDDMKEDSPYKSRHILTIP